MYAMYHLLGVLGVGVTACSYDSFHKECDVIMCWHSIAQVLLKEGSLALIDCSLEGNASCSETCPHSNTSVVSQ